jgi:hypothetical protein
MTDYYKKYLKYKKKYLELRGGMKRKAGSELKSESKRNSEKKLNNWVELAKGAPKLFHITPVDNIFDEFKNFLLTHFHKYIHQLDFGLFYYLSVLYNKEKFVLNDPYKLIKEKIDELVDLDFKKYLEIALNIRRHIEYKLDSFQKELYSKLDEDKLEEDEMKQYIDMDEELLLNTYPLELVYGDVYEDELKLKRRIILKIIYLFMTEYKEVGDDIDSDLKIIVKILNEFNKDSQYFRDIPQENLQHFLRDLTPIEIEAFDIVLQHYN